MHLVDRPGVFVVDAILDQRHQGVVHLDITRWARLHQHDVRAFLQGFPHGRAGLDPEGLGLIAGGDAAGGR